MKKIAIFISIIIVGLFFVDRIGGTIMLQVNKKSKEVLAPKLQYLKNDIHENVVLIGNSRCHHHYIPSILEDTLKMSVYNAGMGGADNIYSDYIVLCHLLNRCKPKVICLEVSPSDYNMEKNSFSATRFFAPLFGNDKADSIYRLAGNYHEYRISHLYRYNAKAASNLWGLVINRQKNADKGYMPLPKPNQFPTKAYKEEGDTIVDQQKLECLDRFCSLCKSNGIKLIFTVSPKFTKVGGSYYGILKDFAIERGIPFMDYHTCGLYLNRPHYFKDHVHLWDKGAKMFSKTFAHDLKNIINIVDPIIYQLGQRPVKHI